MGRDPAASLAISMRGPPRARIECSIQLYLDVLARHLHLIGLEVVVDRRSQPLAGLDLEPAAMQWAFDTIAVEPALAQEGESVGAEIVGGVDRTVDVVERDLALAQRHAHHVARLDGRPRGDRNPVTVDVHA